MELNGYGGKYMSTLLYESFLRSQGFKYEKTNYGIIFKYQGKGFLIADNGIDELYLQLLMPSIYTMTSPTEEYKILKVLNDVNKELKAIKACLHDNDVWLHIEMFIDKTPNIEDFFIRLLDILMEGYVKFVEKMRML